MKTREFLIKELGLLNLPTRKSHKGDHGRVLVLGGSSLFHSASLWAAELLAHFVDLVFYYSPFFGNQQLALNLKKQFRNGIVIIEKDLDSYIQEADVILLGPGMMRQGKEGILTERLVNDLLIKHPQKKIVIDAGALQRLNISKIQPQHLLTPHWQEFQQLFPRNSLQNPDFLTKHPANYLIKKQGIDYILSWEKPKELIRVNLGNEGLTKGGSGDLLAALACAFYVHNPAWFAAAAASLILNSAADDLYKTVGPFYTTTELLQQIPKTFWQLLKFKNPK